MIDKHLEKLAANLVKLKEGSVFHPNPTPQEPKDLFAVVSAFRKRPK